MTIVNTKTGEIQGLRFSRSKIDLFHVNKNYVYLSTSFCIANKLKAGDRIQFINEGSDWRFFVSPDVDGFPLAKSKSLHSALCIFNAGLVKMINRSTGNFSGTMYAIQKTIQEMKGSPIFMILTNKPIKKKSNIESGK